MVRPSTWFYPRFSLPMVRSPGFGSNPYNKRPIQARFHYAYDRCLKLLHELTRWIVLQKARRHRTSRLRLLVRTQFQDLFHSPSGVLLTFPSRYLYTIDRKIYLALEGGPSRFGQGFSCPGLLDIWLICISQLVNIRLARLGIPGFHRLWRTFPSPSARIANFLPYA